VSRGVEKKKGRCNEDERLVGEDERVRWRGETMGGSERGLGGMGRVATCFCVNRAVRVVVDRDKPFDGADTVPELS
jgi:hypothetical protein